MFISTFHDILTITVTAESGHMIQRVTRHARLSLCHSLLSSTFSTTSAPLHRTLRLADQTCSHTILKTIVCSHSLTLWLHLSLHLQRHRRETTHQILLQIKRTRALSNSLDLSLCSLTTHTRMRLLITRQGLHEESWFENSSSRPPPNSTLTLIVDIVVAQVRGRSSSKDPSPRPLSIMGA